MNHRKRKTTAVLGDLRRLIVPLDVLYTVGSLIYRRSLRYTMMTAGIAMVGIAAGWAGLPGFTVRQALMLPLVIGGLSLACGTLLKVVPSLISSRLLLVAQASGLNLMEDYRKSEVDEHLNALWDRVFQYECRLGMAGGAAGVESADPLGPDQTENEALARAKKGFFVRAHKALTSHLPQIHQMHLVGLDLRYFEDWRDGAYLDRSDTKLIEQFEGSATLAAVRAETGLVGPAAAVLFNARRLVQRFWFLFVTRIMAIHVASCVQQLNRRHDTDLFNTQVLLWPGTEDGEWLGDFDGARETVLQLRTETLRRIFGPDLETARHVLDHMLYCSFAAATELRLRYDPDYCDGTLGYDAIGDLTAEGKNRRDFQRAKGFVDRARRDLEQLTEYLGDHRPELLEAANAPALRAVRIALMVDRGRRQRKLRRRANRPIGGSAGELDRLIGRAVADAQIYTRRIVAVRTHHELTRLARKGYHKLIKALAYEDI